MVVVLFGLRIAEVAAMNARLGGMLAVVLCVQGAACAQSTRVPAAFQDLYSSLQQSLDAFDRTVSSHPTPKSSVMWSAELLTANCNRGRALLDPASQEYIGLELDRLQSLGVKAVTMCIGFPVLYQPFFVFNGDPGDYPRFVKFYRDLSAQIHGRGLKLIVESSVLFPGGYSRESGFRLAEYYPTLQSGQLNDGRAQTLIAIAKEVRPDFLNLGSEPDTEAAISKNRAFTNPAAYGDTISSFVRQLRQAGVAGIPIGAGIGTWQPEGPAFVRALLASGIDYLDLHVYPVNNSYLDNAITYADMAHSAGKQVAISEAWLLKARNSELGRINAINNPATFARDVDSFWMPLDQKFLGDMVKYANWKNLLYFSPFWTRYFWSYLDYAAVDPRTPPGEVLQQASRSALRAMQSRNMTPTGGFYRNEISGK
jgi:hypothetical protein